MTSTNAFRKPIYKSTPSVFKILRQRRSSCSSCPRVIERRKMEWKMPASDSRGGQFEGRGGERRSPSRSGRELATTDYNTGALGSTIGRSDRTKNVLVERREYCNIGWTEASILLEKKDGQTDNRPERWMYWTAASQVTWTVDILVTVFLKDPVQKKMREMVYQIDGIMKACWFSVSLETVLR